MSCDIILINELPETLDLDTYYGYDGPNQDTSLNTSHNSHVSSEWHLGIEMIELRAHDGGVDGVPHGYFVYTNHEGDQWYFRGGPGGSGGTTHWGSINADWGVFDDDAQDWDDNLNDQRYILMAGDDLSHIKQIMINYGILMDQLEVPYSPTPIPLDIAGNSWSVIGTMLHHMGFDDFDLDSTMDMIVPGYGENVFEEGEANICTYDEWYYREMYNMEPPAGYVAPTTSMGPGSPLPTGVVTIVDPPDNPDDGESPNIPPIVLDLDGDGLELISLSDSSVRHDIDGDGVTEQTGWVGPDDGILAFDADGDGMVDGPDEFGLAQYANCGCDATDLDGLRSFDANGDGVFDAADPQWADFLVWRDINGDGLSQEAEIQTLADIGVTAIDLTAEGDATTVAGNTVHGLGEFIYQDGSSGTYGDVGLTAVEGIYIVGTKHSDASAPMSRTLSAAAKDMTRSSACWEMIC